MGCWPINNSKDILCTSINPHSHYLHCDSNNKQLILCPLWYTKLNVQFLPLSINCLLLSESFQSRIYNVHLHMYLITCSIVIYQLHFVLFKSTGAGWTIILQTFVYEMNISHGLIPSSTKLLCWLAGSGACADRMSSTLGEIRNWEMSIPRKYKL